MESVTVVSVRTNTSRLSVSYTSCARVCSEIKTKEKEDLPVSGAGSMATDCFEHSEIKTKEKADLPVSGAGSMATDCFEHSKIKTKEKADLITSVGCRLHGDRLL